MTNEPKVPIRRCNLTDGMTYELWLYWEGKWELRGTGYESDLAHALAGYSYIRREHLKIRVRSDYDGPIPEWGELVA